MLGAHRDVLRVLGAHLHALLALHPRLRKGLAFHPWGSITAASAASALIRLCALASATGVIRESGLAVPTAPATAAVRPRIRRGCDRQRGYAGCEKNPGHNLSPSNGENGPFAPPFQPLNGWNLHPIALG